MKANPLARIAQEHGIRLILQFGSTVTGREHARSDVDLAVEFEVVPVTFDALGSAMGDLQRLFPQREVDVAMYQDHKRFLALEREYVARALRRAGAA